MSGDTLQNSKVKKMLGTPNNGRFRHAFSVVNGAQDLGPNSAPASTVGSECGGIDFTREDVEALLSERMKYKNKFNYKVSYFVFLSSILIAFFG